MAFKIDKYENEAAHFDCTMEHIARLLNWQAIIICPQTGNSLVQRNKNNRKLVNRNIYMHCEVILFENKSKVLCSVHHCKNKSHWLSLL